MNRKLLGKMKDELSEELIIIIIIIIIIIKELDFATNWLKYILILQKLEKKSIIYIKNKIIPNY